jgi:hypothetical protein
MAPRPTRRTAALAQVQAYCSRCPSRRPRSLPSSFGGDADGVLRVGALDLADVYAVIAYVMRHRAEIDAYLVQRRVSADAVRTANERRWSSAGVRDRLLARR